MPSPSHPPTAADIALNQEEEEEEVSICKSSTDDGQGRNFRRHTFHPIKKGFPLPKTTDGAIASFSSSLFRSTFPLASPPPSLFPLFPRPPLSLTCTHTSPPLPLGLWRRRRKPDHFSSLLLRFGSPLRGQPPSPPPPSRAHSVLLSAPRIFTHFRICRHFSTFISIVK